MVFWWGGLPVNTLITSSRSWYLEGTATKPSSETCTFVQRLISFISIIRLRLLEEKQSRDGLKRNWSSSLHGLDSYSHFLRTGWLASTILKLLSKRDVDCWVCLFWFNCSVLCARFNILKNVGKNEWADCWSNALFPEVTPWCNTFHQ